MQPIEMCSRPGHAVEEAQPQDVELEEAHHRREQQVQHAGALAELVSLARGERGVAVLALEVGGEVVGRVVHQVAFERAGRDRVEHFLVHQVVAPARVHAVEEARAPVGIALAVREPAAEEAVAPRHAVDRRDRRRRARAGCSPRARRDALVGVEAEHPVVLRLLDGELLLAAEAEPFLLHHARAAPRRDLAVASVEAGIDHDDLVDEREALEAGIEHCARRCA